MDLHTIGHMSQRLQRAPGHLECLIRELDVEPALTLNGLAYYAVDDEQRIDRTIREQEAAAILRGRR